MEERAVILDAQKHSNVVPPNSLRSNWAHGFFRAVYVASGHIDSRDLEKERARRKAINISYAREGAALFFTNTADATS